MVIDVRGAIPSGYTGRYPMGNVVGLAIHHSVTHMGPDASGADELGHLQAIDAYHTQKGYGGFGYHLAAFESGRSYLVGDLAYARAHVAFRNFELVGVVLIATLTGETPRAPLVRAARDCVAHVGATYPGRPLRGHREWVTPEAEAKGWGTICPGNTYRQWLPQLRNVEQEADDMTPEDQARLTRIEKAVAALNTALMLTVMADDGDPDQWAIREDGTRRRLASLKHRRALEAAGAYSPDDVVKISRAQLEAIPLA